jgi:outer membrane receptor for ferrienterochelin and colicin
MGYQQVSLAAARIGDMDYRLRENKCKVSAQESHLMLICSASDTRASNAAASIAIMTKAQIQQNAMAK